jgi:hypothetical protein
MNKRVILILLGLMILEMASASASGQTVLKHIRLGNQVEGLTFVPTGPYADHIVFIDGDQFFGFPAEGQGNSQKQLLFDFSKLALIAPPRGVAYIPEERLFVFTDPSPTAPTTTLHLTDHKGNPKGAVIFRWPEDWAAAAPYAEGVVWVPPSAPRYPGCFIFSGIETGFPFEYALFVVDRKGNFVAKITANVDPFLFNFYITGLAYSDGKLLAGLIDNTLWELDLDGNVLLGPMTVADTQDVEGVAVLPRGRIVLTTLGSGRMIYLDSNFVRLPEEKDFHVGFGLSSVINAVWDDATSEFLVHATFYDPSQQEPQVAAIDAGLTSSRRAIDLLPYFDLGANVLRIDYASDVQQILLARRGPPPRGFYFFDQSGFEVDFARTPNNVNSGGFAYIANLQQIVLRSIQAPLVLQFYDRYATFGPPLRTIDLSSLGFPVIADVAYFNPAHPSGGELQVLGGDQFYVLDFVGNLLAQYPNKMGVFSAKPISSGPYAGAWVGTNSNTGELFIFTLP